MTYEQLIQGLDGGSIQLILMPHISNLPILAIQDFVYDAQKYWEDDMIFAVLQEIVARGIQSTTKVIAEVTTAY
jgi:hypothetical protein